MTDTATLTGSYHATGTITFDLYGPHGVTIDYTADHGQRRWDIHHDVRPTGRTAGVVDRRDLQWVVTYSGDGNNNGVASSFGNESGQVHAANPSLGTNWAFPADVTLQAEARRS